MALRLREISLNLEENEDSLPRKAAEILGLDRSTLRARMQKLDICKP